MQDKKAKSPKRQVQKICSHEGIEKYIIFTRGRGGGVSNVSGIKLALHRFPLSERWDANPDISQRPSPTVCPPPPSPRPPQHRPCLCKDPLAVQQGVLSTEALENKTHITADDKTGTARQAAEKSRNKNVATTGFNEAKPSLE